ncbi:single-stranded DNA-binding protein [Actinomadura litoris]|uniref:single-stranded DNA-binding protein n=1 Tax=Actinomadura litoris TaxID=2678616 RepID=UPI001FA6DF6E|nr:single-stranded DNA-binding protein [Actinomadura litoris]
MAGDTVITIVGNLVEDPNLRFTPSGQAVASFRIASTPRSFDRQSGEWKDGESLFLTCNVWRQAAENCAESLQRGMRVIVQGRLKQRSYETREGEKRTVFEIEVDEVGPSLRNATAKVNKTQRQGGGGGGFGGGGGGQGGGFGGGGGQGDGGGFGGGQQQGGGGFGGGGQQGGGAPANDPWATGGGGGGGGGGYSDDPPF